MDPELTRALAPVLADLRATGGSVPRIEEHDWTGSTDRPGAMLRGRAGTGQGVAVTRGRPPAEQVAEATDRVQEWAIEDLWGAAPTNWPRCPHHPTTHPLEVRLEDDAVWWACPRDGSRISVVGRLG